MQKKNPLKNDFINPKPFKKTNKKKHVKRNFLTDKSWRKPRRARNAAGLFNARAFKKSFNRRSYGHNFFEPLFSINPPKYRLNIKICSNNIFMHLVKGFDNKVIVSRNSGSLKLKVTKKRIKYMFSLVVSKFLSLVKFSKSDNLLLFISCPVRMRKKVIRRLAFLFNQRSTFISFYNRKSYNGCRPAKKTRKKRKRLNTLFKT